MFIFLLLLIYRISDLLISLLAPHFIPYLGFFSYGETMLPYKMPDFIRALSNFDGIFYVRIALQGYSHTEEAFFPLYPIFIYLVNVVFGNPIVSAIFVSNLALIGAILIFYKYLRLFNKQSLTRWLLIFLLAYPTSFYFGVMYTESLFFLLFISALYFFKTKHFALAAFFAMATALTRVTGVFLAIPLIITLWPETKLNGFKNAKRFIITNWKQLLVCIAPFVGLSLYCLYLWKTAGDPFYFFSAQESFGAHRSTNLILPPQVIYRYLRIFITANHNFQYFVAVLELAFYVFVLSVLSYDLVKQLKAKAINWERLGLNIFSMVNVIVPSLTGTLTAIPRYTLLSISIFFVFAEIKSKPLKVLLLVIFGALHILLLALFIQGYYVT